MVGYGSFSLCVIFKEGLCPSSGDINGLMMMMNENKSIMMMIIIIIIVGKHLFITVNQLIPYKK
jgi:hypothetical protein